MRSWVSDRTDISPVWKAEAQPVQSDHVCTALKDLQHEEDIRSYHLYIPVYVLNKLYNDYARCHVERVPLDAATVLQQATGRLHWLSWDDRKQTCFRSIAHIQ